MAAKKKRVGRPPLPEGVPKKSAHLDMRFTSATIARIDALQKHYKLRSKGDVVTLAVDRLPLEDPSVDDEPQTLSELALHLDLVAAALRQKVPSK